MGDIVTEICHYVEKSIKVQGTYVQTKILITALETSNSGKLSCAWGIYVLMGMLDPVSIVSGLYTKLHY
jgi:hypothetical protein